MTLSANVTIEGLDELQKKLGDKTILTSEFKIAEREALQIVGGQAKLDAAKFSTLLPQSIQILRDSGGLSGTIYSVAKTARSIHDGRAPGHPPSIEKLQTWLSRRGNTFSVTTHKAIRHKNTKLGRKLRAQELAGLRGEAVRIQKIIRRDGTKGLPFVIPAIYEKKAAVDDLFHKAVDRAVRRIAGR